MGEVAGNEDRYIVRSVVRALGILDELAAAEQRGLSVTEIADNGGLSKSATFSILQTLMSLNYVADTGVGQNRRYRLGHALIRLGDIARGQMSLRDVARPILENVATNLGVSVRLGVLEGNRVSMVDRFDSPGGLRIDLRMGQQEWLHSTAVGKALLSTLTEGAVRELLNHEPLTRQTRHTLVTVEDVLGALPEIRLRGYSIDDQEDFEGVLCIGAPVYVTPDSANAAISVTMLKAQATPRRIDQVGQALVAAAREMSLQLGCTPPAATTNAAEARETGRAASRRREGSE